MRLSIRHRSHYRYDPAAQIVSLRLRLFPPKTSSQTPNDWRVTVNGDLAEPLFFDGSGDAEGLWRSDEELTEVEVIAEGAIETEDANGVLKGLRDRMPTGVLLRETPLTEPSDAIRDLATEAKQDDTLATLHALSALVNEKIEYKAGVTGPETTAAEALALGAGVCQDHAHVFISAARTLDIPARYVAGYMLAGDAEAELLETHGWGEAHVAGLGWIGFDCSNGLCPTDRYVRLSSGLDAAAAAPIRGHVLGQTDETLEASVEIARSQQ
jgi:transglutaminase-like putative cysteine protease